MKARNFLAGTLAIVAIGAAPHIASAAPSLSDALYSPAVASEATKGFPFAPTRAVQIDVTKRTRAFFRGRSAHCNPGFYGARWFCKVTYAKRNHIVTTEVRYYEDGRVREFSALVVPPAMVNLV